MADRLFSSIPRAWRMNTSDLSEVKELTPEWYSLPVRSPTHLPTPPPTHPNHLYLHITHPPTLPTQDFLRNVNHLDLGTTQAGEVVNDVVLPPWAPTAEDFIRIQREALESEFVSQRLHHWVDLIFGYKQRGPAAIEAKNVFFYLTYSGAVDLAQIEDPGQ